MRILIACEESQIVCKSFRAKGHEAYSCDIQDCSGGYPEWHLKMDVFRALCYENWQMVIMHPDCTCLAVSGNRWYSNTEVRQRAIKWTQMLWDCAVSRFPKVCLENPVSVVFQHLTLGALQYIQPWQFGHGETKKTGLYLHGLPKLTPTNIVKGREQKIWRMPPSENRKKMRSKTFLGIARAMADQWG